MKAAKMKKYIAMAKEGKVVSIDCGGELGARALMKEIMESNLRDMKVRFVVGFANLFIIPAPSVAIEIKEVE